MLVDLPTVGRSSLSFLHPEAMLNASVWKRLSAEQMVRAAINHDGARIRECQFINAPPNGAPLLPTVTKLVARGCNTTDLSQLQGGRLTTEFAGKFTLGGLRSCSDGFSPSSRFGAGNAGKESCPWRKK